MTKRDMLAKLVFMVYSRLGNKMFGRQAVWANG